MAGVELAVRGRLSARSIVRRRLAAQRLAGSPLEDPAAVVRRLGAVQSQDFAETLWAVGQRLRGWRESDVLGAFQRGEIVRTHVLRPTWHFVAPEDLRWMQALTAARVHRQNERTYREHGLDAGVLQRATEVICGALNEARRPLTRAELGEALDRAAIAASGVRLAYLFMYAELECAICNGPMRGRQHTYLPFDVVVPPTAPPSRERALAELARRYFLSRGPATLRDFCWWSGLTTEDCRAAICAIADELHAERGPDGTLWYSNPAADTQPPRTPAVLLANVDELIIAYQDVRIAQSRTGVLDPPWDRIALIDGLAVGRWRRDLRRRRVRVEIELADHLGASRMAKLRSEVRRLGRFLDREVELDLARSLTRCDT